LTSQGVSSLELRDTIDAVSGPSWDATASLTRDSDINFICNAEGSIAKYATESCIRKMQRRRHLGERYRIWPSRRVWLGAIDSNGQKDSSSVGDCLWSALVRSSTSKQNRRDSLGGCRLPQSVSESF